MRVPSLGLSWSSPRYQQLAIEAVDDAEDGVAQADRPLEDRAEHRLETAPTSMATLPMGWDFVQGQGSGGDRSDLLGRHVRAVLLLR